MLRARFCTQFNECIEYLLTYFLKHVRFQTQNLLLFTQRCGNGLIDLAVLWMHGDTFRLAIWTHPFLPVFLIADLTVLGVVWYLQISDLSTQIGKIRLLQTTSSPIWVISSNVCLDWVYPCKLNNTKTKKIASTAWTTGCPWPLASTTAGVCILASGWLVGRAPAEASLDRRQLEC